VQRLREREVESRVNVSDAEVDHLLATLDAQAGGEIEYRLAHILVTGPRAGVH
jgi:peptidyl-prolyl cis-trans isomerase SurA